LTSAPVGSRQFYTSAALTRGKSPLCKRKIYLIGPRADLDDVKKWKFWYLQGLHHRLSILLNGTGARGYNWATLFLEEINTRVWSSKLGESPHWDSKVWSWVLGTHTWEKLRWRGPAPTINYSPFLSSERPPYNIKPKLSKYNVHGSERICCRGSQMVAWYQDRLADWPSVLRQLWLWTMVRSNLQLREKPEQARHGSEDKKCYIQKGGEWRDWLYLARNPRAA
jgi:hypothetical protein